MQKGGQKRVKIGVFWLFTLFTLFYPIFPILPYFGPDLGVRRLNLELRAKPRGDGMVTNLGLPRIGARPHLGNGVTLKGPMFD